MAIREQPAPGAWQQRTMRRLAYACAVGLLVAWVIGTIRHPGAWAVDLLLVAALILLAVYRTP